MEYTRINAKLPLASRVGLGTWAIGGWMWGGTDERLALSTIERAIDEGITFIDTAPVYGFGSAESLIGRAISKKRDVGLVIATKAGLDWSSGKIRRNLSPSFLKSELDNSLRRLGVEKIDLYQIHWPNHDGRIQEIVEVVARFVETGKVTAIGVCNFSAIEIEQLSGCLPIATVQAAYNIFDRDEEQNSIHAARACSSVFVSHSSLCRGLLTGAAVLTRKYGPDDIRNYDPKYSKEALPGYTLAVRSLEAFARENFDRSLGELAIRWLLDRGCDIALWGARDPKQIEHVRGVFGWRLTDGDLIKIDEIVTSCIAAPVGTSFLRPK